MPASGKGSGLDESMAAGTAEQKQQQNISLMGDLSKGAHQEQFVVDKPFALIKGAPLVSQGSLVPKWNC
jgi:hypothetical protein